MAGFIALAVGLGTFLGALVSVRRYVLHPFHELIEDFRALLDLPELVRDISSTFTRYISDNEERHREVDLRLNAIEKAVNYVLAIVEGRPHAGPPPTLLGT
jgi:hypothetical protein